MDQLCDEPGFDLLREQSERGSLDPGNNADTLASK